MKDSRGKKPKCKRGTASLRSSSMRKGVLLGKCQAQEYRDTGSKKATSTLGCKNRGTAKRFREGSPSTWHTLEHFWNGASRFNPPQCRKGIDELEEFREAQLRQQGWSSCW